MNSSSHPSPQPKLAPNCPVSSAFLNETRGLDLPFHDGPLVGRLPKIQATEDLEGKVASFLSVPRGSRPTEKGSLGSAASGPLTLRTDISVQATLQKLKNASTEAIAQPRSLQLGAGPQKGTKPQQAQQAQREQSQVSGGGDEDEDAGYVYPKPEIARHLLPTRPVSKISVSTSLSHSAFAVSLSPPLATDPAAAAVVTAAAIVSAAAAAAAAAAVTATAATAATGEAVVATEYNALNGAPAALGSGSKMWGDLGVDALGLIRREFAAFGKAGATVDEFIWMMSRRMDSLATYGDRAFAGAMIELFSDIDANRSGRINWDEFTEYVRESASEDPEAYSADDLERFARSASFVDQVVRPAAPEKITYLREIERVATCDVDGFVRLYLHDTMALADAVSMGGAQPLAVCCVAQAVGWYLAVSTNDFVVHLLDAALLKPRLKLRTKEAQTCLLWDGLYSMLVMGGLYGTVRFWSFKDSASPKEVRAVVPSEHFASPQAQAQALATDRDGALRARLAVTDMIFLEDLGEIATSSLDGLIRLWDRRTGVKKHTLTRGHEKGVVALAFAPLQKLLISVGFEHEIVLWNPFVDGLFTRVRGHDFPLCGVAVIREKNQFVSLDTFGHLKVWDVRSFTCLYTSDIGVPPDSGHGLVFLGGPGGAGPDRFVTSDSQGLILLEHVEPEFSDRTDEHPLVAVFFNPNLMTVATVAQRSVKIWDAHSARLLRVYRDPFSGPDAALHITAAAQNDQATKIYLGSGDGRVCAINYKNGVKVRDFPSHDREVTALLHVSEQRLLISSSLDKTVAIHDEVNIDLTATHVTAPNAVRALLTGHTGPVRCISYSMNLGIVASGSADRTIRVREVRDGTLSGICRGAGSHDGEISALAFMEHRPLLISADVEGVVIVWSVPPVVLKYQILLRLNAGLDHPITCLSLLNNASMIVAGDDDGCLHTWDLTRVLQHINVDLFTVKEGNGGGGSMAALDGATSSGNTPYPRSQRGGEDDLAQIAVAATWSVPDSVAKRTVYYKGLELSRARTTNADTRDFHALGAPAFRVPHRRVAVHKDDVAGLFVIPNEAGGGGVITVGAADRLAIVSSLSPGSDAVVCGTLRQHPTAAARSAWSFPLDLSLQIVAREQRIDAAVARFRARSEAVRAAENARYAELRVALHRVAGERDVASTPSTPATRSHPPPPITSSNSMPRLFSSSMSTRGGGGDADARRQQPAEAASALQSSTPFLTELSRPDLLLRNNSSPTRLGAAGAHQHPATHFILGDDDERLRQQRRIIEDNLRLFGRGGRSGNPVDAWSDDDGGSENGDRGKNDDDSSSTTTASSSSSSYEYNGVDLPPKPIPKDAWDSLGLPRSMRRVKPIPGLDEPEENEGRKREVAARLVQLAPFYSLFKDTEHEIKASEPPPHLRGIHKPSNPLPDLPPSNPSSAPPKERRLQYKKKERKRARRVNNAGANTQSLAEDAAAGRPYQSAQSARDSALLLRLTGDQQVNQQQQHQPQSQVQSQSQSQSQSQQQTPIGSSSQLTSPALLGHTERASYQLPPPRKAEKTAFPVDRRDDLVPRQAGIIIPAAASHNPVRRQTRSVITPSTPTSGPPTPHFYASPSRRMAMGQGRSSPVTPRPPARLTSPARSSRQTAPKPQPSTALAPLRLKVSYTTLEKY
jgi:WD40 repeat protein